MNNPGFLKGDAMRLPLREKSVHCVVTSPPYLAQRVYGDSDGEVGLEGTVADYVESTVAWMREVKRVLMDGGTCWLVLGDKSNGSGGAGGDYNPGGEKQGKRRYGKFYDPKYLRGQFLDVPGKVVAGLQDDKWRMRLGVVWEKTGYTSREDLAHINRPRVAHEMIYMLTLGKPGEQSFYPADLPEHGSVWHMPTAAKEKKDHDAPFPDELARRCILASTQKGQVVLDPFSGSGTTPRVAKNLGRVGIGMDLYQEGLK